MIATDVTDENLPFTFTYLDADFPSMKKLNADLTKWGFGEDLKLLRFKSDRALDPNRTREFVNSFLTSDHVRQVLASETKTRVISSAKLNASFEIMSTLQTSLKFFRTLEENDVVMDCGRIRGRLEEDYEGIPIYDVLREALFLPDSEKFAAFSSQDRKELLFRIFRNVVVGGAANQYEDNIEAYLTATGLIYKDLVSVKKNDSGDLQVMSTVWEVTDLGPGGDLFSKDHLSNFCYLAFDPQTRQVNFWYFQHRAIW